MEFLIDILEDTRVDAVDIDGQTALYHASMGGHVVIVRRLIELGANLDRRNKVYVGVLLRISLELTQRRRCEMQAPRKWEKSAF